MEEPARGDAAVAIVMRTKNRPVLLARAIDDVLGQSFGDFRLVIVNDGGDRGPVDDLVSRASERAAGRVAVVHNEQSRGMEAASNIGIRASRSRYVCIHDDDDTWHPDFLARTVGYLEASADTGVMVRTEIVHERIDGSTVEELGREIFWADVHRITLFEMLRINRAVPISFLYRREAHDRVGYYDESLPAVGDWEFHLRFLRELTVGFIDGAPLAFWHHRRGSGGDLGNSVLARPHEHEDYDLLVRERYLKEDVSRHGLGALLYLTKIVDQEFEETRRRLDRTDEVLGELLATVRDLRGQAGALEAAVSDASLVSLLRRRYRRLKGRLRPGRP